MAVFSQHTKMNLISKNSKSIAIWKQMAIIVTFISLMNIANADLKQKYKNLPTPVSTHQTTSIKQF